jgi:hypothetical protein
MWRSSFALAVAPWLAALAVAQSEDTSATSTSSARRLAHEAVSGEHPLAPTLRLARDGLKRLEKVKDYSANLIRRERIDGRLLDHQYQFIKVRHSPLSIYVYYQSPKRGSELIYVEGKNDGQLWAHETGANARLVGTVSLDPEGPRARKESRYPITQAGLKPLALHVIAKAENDQQYGECEVKVFPDAKINGRPCLSVQITHPAPRREFSFHVARVFFDHELGFAVRYEAYGWPARTGDEPPLIEEFTFSDAKLDSGFTDRDFDITNPAYAFPRSAER